MMTDTPAFRAAEERHLAPPEPEPILSGIIARHLTAGIYAGREVAIDYELSEDLTIFEAYEANTGKELDTREILEADRAEFSEQIRETL